MLRSGEFQCLLSVSDALAQRRAVSMREFLPSTVRGESVALSCSSTSGAYPDLQLGVFVLLGCFGALRLLRGGGDGVSLMSVTTGLWSEPRGVCVCVCVCVCDDLESVTLVLGDQNRLAGRPKLRK